MKKVLPIAAGLLTAALVAGCGHEKPLVGTWTGSTTTPQGVTMNTTLTLTDDGKDTSAAQFAGPNGNNRLDASGTYTVSDTTLTQTYTSLKLNGQPVPQSKGPIPEPSTFKIDGDSLTLISLKGGPPLILTRQKS